MQINNVVKKKYHCISGTIKGTDVGDEASSHLDNIYDHLVAKPSRIINNFTTFESNKIQWAKVMNFQEPTVKIFCPDLVALRNTFRSVITVKLVYSVVGVLHLLYLLAEIVSQYIVYAVKGGDK